jgi:anti-sigma B factor antagonist
MSLCNFGTPYWRGADSLLVKKSESTPMPGINIVAGQDDYVVCLSGRVDIDLSPAIRDRLLALLQTQSAKSVSINLTAVSHMDSSGLATLIEALKIARSNNTKLTLRDLNDRLLSFFELTGLLPLFNGTTPAVTESAQRAV